VTPFHDLAEYMALPRVGAIRLSPDGRRLVAVVSALAADRKSFRSAVWELEPDGARRLTRSAAGESGPAFLPDGSLLFTSARPDPDAEPDKKTDGTSLWCLPAGGGEAFLILNRPGGLGGVVVAAGTGTVVFTASTMPGDAGADPERRTERKDAGVSAILHESYPIRYWDHELGPALPRLFVLEDDGEARDLTPDADAALFEQSAAVTPDGSTVITGWWVPTGRGDHRSELVAIDVASGARRTLVSEAAADFSAPVVSPDGRFAICSRESHGDTAEPLDTALWLVPLDGGEARDLTPGLDLWPGGAAWSPDSGTVYFQADQRGRRPVFAVDLAASKVTRITEDDAAYTQVAAAPDGRHLYALRSGIGAEPVAVRFELTKPSESLETRVVGAPLTLPGRVEEITAEAPDGTEIRGWLVLPEGDGPAPLVLWPHGGPHMSWNAWNWRWCHWVLAAHGYAVLMPDPALSTGYGQDHIRRGHGRWGAATYDDLMAITDAALARDDIDADRTAVMGGSFGGYMANWIAGHTERFSAIISHASVYKFEIKVTADAGNYFIREFGDPAEEPERWEANDPATHAAKIRTPMLVIHGNKDYRVPIGNALWLWWDLIRNDVDAKFLYFPDENHWILTPGNATIWYETVLAFLAQHLRGEEWKRPELL
jgi:dipeptidyl aminopeptidase/acylaminoacyl peptidase